MLGDVLVAPVHKSGVWFVSVCAPQDPAEHCLVTFSTATDVMTLVEGEHVRGSIDPEASTAATAIYSVLITH